MAKKLKLNGEIIFALLILVFLLVLILDSTDLPARTKRLPLLVAWVTLIFTIGELGLCIRKQLKNGAGSDKNFFNKKVMKKVVVGVGFMLLMIVLWNILGFIIASIIITCLFAYYLGARNKIGVAVSAICVTLGLYYIFGSFLGVPLPKGLLFTKFF